MSRPDPLIEVERRGEVFCVRLRQPQMDEPRIYALAAELHALVIDGGCRRLALSLGPESPECLYSIFLAQLIGLQRTLRERGGELILCHVQPAVRDIFMACGLEPHFAFLPDFEAAITKWTPHATIR